MDTTRTARQFDSSRLEIIGPADCVRLFASVPLGRLVYTHGGLPAVRLVNFVVDEDTIVFSTGQGDKFRAAERGDVVAFEADEVDAERHVGWTVTAIGHLSVVTDDEAAELRRTLALHSWMPMEEPQLVRLGIESVQGRRLVPWGRRPRLC
ncbi:pyridoxamine 5'-phosphate oxidase family protein [Kribbella sp. VKM Ac-2566]|uniref:pyridoxamine 5'-phosphate oxidase family protein n=1 Tax=Kribbella sp. VKM Ac-2566 TaxID=2512218 RepID=UPI00106375D5|nr:pyridoxamine 5'-phosphate oxidase family protein [Kribbella sp. VKM Ac-2566]TDW86555.1 pyridoxamine 5'-phosphate oxidase-like protein [Kribbella sp. VKM Ac-2566]